MQLLLIALTQALNALTPNLLYIAYLLGVIIALSTIYQFQTGKVAHHDKLAGISYRQTGGIESI